MRIHIRMSMIFIVLNLLTSESLASYIVKKTMLCIDKKAWHDCETIAKGSNDKALVKIALYQKLLDTKYKNNNFAEVIKFIRTNPHWPRLDRLAKVAEKYLNHDTDPKLIVEWFSKNQPLTSQGYKFYAIASSKLEKDPLKLTKIIKNGWIYGDFTSKEEKQYLSSFKKIINAEDHVKKIDEYLWSSNTASAKKYMRFVSSGYKQNFNTQIAIINKLPGTEELFKGVSEKYYTPALLFNYLNSKRHQVPDERSITLFKKVRGTNVHLDRWCKLQTNYARGLLEKKDFVGSYEVSLLPFAVSKGEVREAEFFSGWVALRFLQKPSIALEHFKEYMKVVEKPFNKSKGQYWLARTYEKLGNMKTANKYYNLASKYPHTFYGQVAHIELKKYQITLPSKPTIDSNHLESIKENEVIRAIEYLAQYGRQDIAALYAKDTITKAENSTKIVLVADIIAKNCNTHHAADVAWVANAFYVPIISYTHPTPYRKAVQSSATEEALTYGVMKQESVFNTQTINPKAFGVMQLTKETATDVDESLKSNHNIEKLIQDTGYNIQLGNRRLDMLLKRFNNSYLLATVAYNSGYKRTTSWIDRFGDPRQFTSLRQTIDWIELIPFSETRNYVHRILENIQVYRCIINSNNNLKLKTDLLQK